MYGILEKHCLRNDQYNQRAATVKEHYLEYTSIALPLKMMNNFDE